MLLIPTYIAPVKNKGLGLFTKIDVPKNMRIWEENSDFDRKLTKEQVVKLPKTVQDWILEYSPFDGYFHYIDLDFFKHTNHSWEPNITMIDNKFIALRKIKKDEEITCDYSQFDLNFAQGDYGFEISK